MRKKEVDLEARRALVKDVCAKYDSKNRWRETEQGRNFWFDIEHGFAFCAHEKVWFVKMIWGALDCVMIFKINRKWANLFLPSPH